MLGFNESFSYSSLCPLSLDNAYLDNLPESRVLGYMEGSYLMVTGVGNLKLHLFFISCSQPTVTMAGISGLLASLLVCLRSLAARQRRSLQQAAGRGLGAGRSGMRRAEGVDM